METNEKKQVSETLCKKSIWWKLLARKVRHYLTTLQSMAWQLLPGLPWRFRSFCSHKDFSRSSTSMRWFNTLVMRNCAHFGCLWDDWNWNRANTILDTSWCLGHLGCTVCLKSLWRPHISKIIKKQLYTTKHTYQVKKSTSVWLMFVHVSSLCQPLPLRDTSVCWRRQSTSARIQGGTSCAASCWTTGAARRAQAGQSIASPLKKGRGRRCIGQVTQKCCIGETVLAVSIVRWNSMHCWCWLAWILRLARNWNAVPEASEKSFSHKISKVSLC